MYYGELTISTCWIEAIPERETSENRVRSTCSRLLERYRSDTYQKFNGRERPKVEYLRNENRIDVLPPRLIDVTSAIYVRVLEFLWFRGC